ncbi:Hypothetical predicted protein [Podarcis lilfordi]|uniref:Uncharacterized protein n=1 Tax=Podarcis lilfordi TaxID=74358 RepID=A0AA35LDA4_9SAUR|nr:Hypothetical predicted protein [Podarcis lilfordi]
MLAGQHEDARELKENLDRLPAFQQRELDDKIKLGQEQLKWLLESLPTDFVLSSRKGAEPPSATGTS